MVDVEADAAAKLNAHREAQVAGELAMSLQAVRVSEAAR